MDGTRTNNHSAPKASDGGYYAALASFIFAMLFFLVRAGTLQFIISPTRGAKISSLAISFILAVYAIYRKYKYHDYSMRAMKTDFLLWIALAFSIPGLIYYLFLS